MARKLYNVWNSFRTSKGLPNAGVWDFLPLEYREAWIEVANTAKILLK